VVIDALIASSGTGGRSRAIHRAVEPERLTDHRSGRDRAGDLPRRAGERVGGSRLELSG
jgi:hypothetical protein